MLADVFRNILDGWWLWMWAVTWQGFVVFIMVLLCDRVIRRFAWPQLRLALWSLFLLKFVIPPMLTSPVSLAALLDQHEMVSLAFLNEGINLKETPSTWLAIAFIIWLAGVVLLSISFANRHRRIVHLARRAKTVSTTDDHLQAMFAELLAELQLRKQPRLQVVDSMTTPAVWGIRRPVILLPEAMTNEFSEEELRLILLHELMHIQRGDRAFQLLLIVLQIVYWFNPLLYVARLRMNRLQELGCDVAVVKHFDDAMKSRYRATLIRTARQVLRQQASTQPQRLPLGAGLVDRLEALRLPQSRSVRYAPVVAVVMLMIKVFIFPMGSFGSDSVFAEKCSRDVVQLASMEDHRGSLHWEKRSSSRDELR